MGVDWRKLGWAEYSMMLAGWNAIHEDEGPAAEVDVGRLRRFAAAHSVH